MSVNNNYDVIIAGGGPAGSSAAINLALRGARVLLVEQKKFPRAKLCGEFISPECADLFARLGVADQPHFRDGHRPGSRRRSLFAGIRCPSVFFWAVWPWLLSFMATAFSTGIGGCCETVE